MKKKSIIILSTIAFLVVVGIIVTIVCVSSSNSIAKKMKKATESVKNVTKVTTVYSVKDGEELVYNNEQEINIIKNAIVRFGKMKKSVNPITQKPVYEVEGTVVGYKDVPPAPRETFQFDDEAMELLKALGFES